MVRLYIPYVHRSRATEVDVIDLGAHRELIFGRAPSAAVRFGPRHDSMVGRHHARLDWDPAHPSVLQISDLHSRNGTWVNGARIVTPGVLQSGDTVQLGGAGPVFEVVLEMAAAVAPRASG